MKQKIILPVICILSSASLLGCNAAEESSYKQGIAAIESGDYDTALTLFEKSAGQDSNLKRDYRGEGLSYLALGDYDKAVDAFENALHESNGLIESMDIDISYYLAVAQTKAGNEEDALETLDAIVAIDPSNATATYLRGKLELIMGDKTAAVSDFDKTVELDPGNYEHYIRICEDLRDAGYTTEGDAYIDKAMSLGGKMTDAVKGELEYYSGQYSDARNDLENARKSKDSEVIALYLGKCYEALGDTDYAKSIYQEALATYPTSGKLYNQLALTLMNGGDYQGALDIIEQGISQGNGDSLQALMYNRVVAYENLYDFKSAADNMKEYLEKYPDDEKAEREYTFLSSR